METKNPQHWPQIDEKILFREEYFDHVGIRSSHSIHEAESALLGAPRYFC